MAKKNGDRLPLYGAYRFGRDAKDPVIDVVHTMLDEAGMNYAEASKVSGVAASTIYQWIEGKTLRPKYCTIAAVAGALGYEQRFVRVRRQT